MPVVIKIYNRPFLFYSEKMINVINTRPRRHPKFKSYQTTIQSFFYISFLTTKKIPCPKDTPPGRELIYNYLYG